jgi:hypothetical protein
MDDLVEIELYQRSLRYKSEYARTWESGSPLARENFGSATSVDIEAGPTISQTLHTHPTSGIALPSAGDVASFKGNYGPTTSHSILGSAYPNADKYLSHYGLEPSGVVMKTTFEQEPLEGVARTLASRINSWLFH